ncbi:cobaltochelatase subunit CobN [uncultured Arcobacter sp.]|uniref:cobaltochelatase subunit CobN n=1 Tax=uncultured Arcobacter sp. TaxID=165434 RepID=UPI0026128B92|nr:cobaltochelatase subunit CobN [uncultured Arcobacter sp.]
MFLLRYFLVLFFSLFSYSNIYAQEEPKSVFSIVSDRSAMMLNSGANAYLKKSQDTITIKTVSQVAMMDDKELTSHIQNADVFLMCGIFGDIVERLLVQKLPSSQLRISLQGDRKLLLLNNDLQQNSYKNIPSRLLKKNDEGLSYMDSLKKKQKEFPLYAFYLQARAYWDNRGSQNISNLFSFLLNPSLQSSTWEKVVELQSIRYFLDAKEEKTFFDINSLLKSIDNSKDILFVLDNDRADSSNEWKIHESLVKNSSFQVVSILTRWGKSSFDAINNLEKLINKLPKKQLYSVVSMHDFVIGGGSFTQEVSSVLKRLNVPIIKGLRVLNFDFLSYSLSSEGLPKNSIHYRLAMPELQGIGQVHLLSLNDTFALDKKTGVLLYSVKILNNEIKNLISKANKWIDLKRKVNKDKKIAIIYYNHPPGRHNIGADNLNVPKSLFTILKNLEKEGYSVGQLPKDELALLDILQEKAINLPNDKKALSVMSSKVNKLSTKEYKRWFQTLPLYIQEEMEQGPLAALHVEIKNFLSNDVEDIASSHKVKAYDSIRNYMNNTMDNLHHALDGVRSKNRQRSINLLEQLKQEYENVFNASQNERKYSFKKMDDLKTAIIKLQIEGIKGWGKAPGKVMTYEEQLLFPSVEFGNILLAPQPPRGWELNEELLHANLSFPPTHQYLAFYHHIKDRFKADAIIHVGRHSTYEFLPRKSVGLTSLDYPYLMIGNLPSIYPYIVDGVGEGIQAKRRGQAVIIDHLTPPLAITKLYDDLLKLRQLIESAESANEETVRKNAIKKIRESIDAMNLKDELIKSMDEELAVRGIGFDEVDDAFLLHELGHYLTHLQEEFMPLGLHTFGKDWNDEAVNTMLKSMAENLQENSDVKSALIQSPANEMNSLINALKGGFVLPGKGNDPIRTKDALPTGRNFYALDGSLIPSSVGYDMGVKLAQKVRDKKNYDIKKKEAIILWSSDTVRDEGAMIAFGLDLLGLKPVWNSRGILKGLELLPLDEKRARRHDVIFTGSGLFRDLYASKLALLDKAVLLALSASYEQVVSKYPALTLALDFALEPLGDLKVKGDEAIEKNSVALNWVEEARELLKQNPNISIERLGKISSKRVFATAPGSYGSGINRLAERSSAWNNRSELSDVFIKRMAYSYSNDSFGELSKESFKRQLSKVENTYLGRASNLYGLIDNNDTFDYLGGLNLAIEQQTGHQPNSFVIDHSNPNKLKITALNTALLQELRGRFLNPQWIEPLMKEGYSGARTMGSEFIEYLWGWQITSPEIIKDWVWEEVKAVYVDDKLDIQLDEFLSSSHQVHVQTNMLAVMLVAIQKDFWKADEKTQKQLSNMFAENIIKYGIPGSGHTHANHPIYDFVKSKISQEMSKKLEDILAQSRMEKITSKESITSIQEVKLEQQNSEQTKRYESTEKNKNEMQSKETYMKYLLALALFVLFLGFSKSLFFNKHKGQ